MKKQLLNRTFWLSVLSASIMIVFIAISFGSLEPLVGTEPTVKYLNDGVVEKTYYIHHGYRTYTGKQDKYGRWEGPVVIETTNDLGITQTNAFYKDGRWHGKITTTSSYGAPSYEVCYNMGYVVNCNKSARLIAENPTTFEILNSKYPWVPRELNDYGFQNSFIEAFTDTLQALMEPFDFEQTDFDTHYQDALDELDGTVYDSLMYTNSILSVYRGLDRLKNSEFRMAVIDRHYSDETHTYNTVKTTYPNYLLSLENQGVTDEDFKLFCQSFDSLLISYGPLDTADPSFLDSLDNRMYRAMEFISTNEKSASFAQLSLKSAVLSSVDKDFRKIWNKIIAVKNSYFSTSSSKEVADIIMSFMLLDFNEADMIKIAAQEAYLKRKNIISPPTLTTEFTGINSTTSVNANGYVIENGGAEVDSRGIVWATFYNPTIDDQIINSGTGIGEFSATLTGLTPGKTYYARSFASNSTGIAYGNCINFSTVNSTAVDNDKMNVQNFNIYPNPTSAVTIFSIPSGASGNAILTIVDLKGREIFKNSLASLPKGDNQVRFDLSNIKDGWYICKLTVNNTTKYRRKLLIIH